MGKIKGYGENNGLIGFIKVNAAMMSSNSNCMMMVMATLL